MSGSRIIKVNDQVVDQFPVFIGFGPTKQSGLTPSNFTITVFRDGVIVSVTVGIAEVNSTGEYKITFTPDTAGYYDVQILNDYNNTIYHGTYDVGVGFGNNIDPNDPTVKRILGLLHENVYIDNTAFDACGQLITSRVRLYDTKDHALLATDGGSEAVGLIAVYTSSANYDGPNRLKDFRQILVYLVVQTTTNLDINVA